MLECAEANELAVLNTWFKKDYNKRVTYESGGRKSQIECVAEDMRVLGVEQSDVHDRLGWRKGIMGKTV